MSQPNVPETTQEKAGAVSNEAVCSAPQSVLGYIGPEDYVGPPQAEYGRARTNGFKSQEGRF